jgi:hypothetical protein
MPKQPLRVRSDSSTPVPSALETVQYVYSVRYQFWTEYVELCEHTVWLLHFNVNGLGGFARFDGDGEGCLDEGEKGEESSGELHTGRVGSLKRTEETGLAQLSLLTILKNSAIRNAKKIRAL